MPGIPTGSTVLTNREAVIFHARRILGSIERDGLPGELGVFGMVLSPLIGKAAAKIEGVTEETAAEIVNAIHALSYKLETQTGNYSPYHYEEQSEQPGEQSEHGGN